MTKIGVIKNYIRDLESSDDEVRRNATAALVDIARGGEAEAVVEAGGIKPLIEAMKDSDEIVRCNAALTLRMIAEGGEA